MNSTKRLIHPKDNDICILRKLNKRRGFEYVYNLDDPIENKSYRKIHEIMWMLEKDGLIEYGRNLGVEENYMRAKIRQKGIDKVDSYYKTWITIILAAIAAIASTLALFV